MKISRIASNYGWRELGVFLWPFRTHATKTFLEAFKTKSQSPYAHFFLYGRSGLYFLLKALNSPKKKVILPAYSCVTVAHAIVVAGYEPVFLDCDGESFQPSPESYLQAIDAETCMIIPTHIFGYPEETETICKKVKSQFPDVFILQDCAHSFFANDLKGRCVTNFGDGALFGCNYAKLVNTVKGGILTLKDQRISEKVGSLFDEVSRQEPPAAQFMRFLKIWIYGFLGVFSFLPKLFPVVSFLKAKTSFLKGLTDYFDEATIEMPADFAFRPFCFQAAVGKVSLDRYDLRIQTRKRLAAGYIVGLQDLKNVRFLPDHAGATWSHFPVLLSDDKSRHGLIENLQKKTSAEIGIIVDYSIPDLKSYMRRGCKPAPRAKSLSERMINLPMTLAEIGLDGKEQSRIQNIVLKEIRDV